MKITPKIVEQIAELSKIKLNEVEKKEYSRDLKVVLQAFDVIDEVDAKDVEPSFHPIKIQDKYREDKEEPCLKSEDVLRFVKQKEKGYFKTGRIV